MSPVPDPMVGEAASERARPLFAQGLASLPSRARTVSAPADKKASIPSAPGSESTAAAPGSEVAEESMGVLSQLAAKCCQLSLWMQLALFAAFLLLDSSRYFVDVRAMSPDPIIAQSVILYQDLLSVLLCLLAVWRYQGFRGLADTFSAELFHCLPTAVLFALSSACFAHAISLGVGAATAVSLNSLYMPMSAFVSRWMFRRAYGWLELHALALLTFSSLTFCELRSRVIGLSGGLQGASWVVYAQIFSCLACLLAERIFKQRHRDREEPELFCAQKARFDLWGALTSVVVLLFLGAPSPVMIVQKWGHLQVIDVAVRVVQSLMAGVLVKHWSTVAKAVVQCLSMLVVFYLGDVVLLGRGQGNMCLYMLALMVALGAFMYQLGRRQTKKRIQSQAEQPQEDTEDTEDIEAIRGLQRALSDPTDQRPARGLQRRRVTSDEALMPDNQALAPSEFEPLSPTQQLASFVPQMPPVERMQLLDRTWLEEERSRDSQFVAWISSKMGILIQLACVGVFVFFDSSRTIVNDQFINGTPIVSQSVTFAQFGASIVVGLLISVIAEGKAGLRAALSWKEILRCFPVAACFSLSQTFTIMAYSAAVSGMLNTVVGNLYLPLSALLSRWIFGRSYSFLEWLALTVLMLSASVFVLLQDSPKGDTPANIFSTGICYVLLSVCMSCLASMLSEKIMKAGSSHFYIQKVNLDVGSFATSVLMLWVCGVTSQRPQDAFWKERDVGGGKMEAGVFVGWDWRMMLVLVVTLLQNWLAGFVAKRLSTVIRSSAQQLSLLIVYFLGDIWLNHKTFDWPVGTTALVIGLSVQVFAFAGQADKAV
ncbi:unnamed protein product [Effrenium voratum]|uniref:Uncharacterized protein n=1 Tax=Effrenium voratum TaxID=2562239 RepID=A0AA36N767_9DINO|nr:unnamed protein product [Effrenium voratum]